MRSLLHAVVICVATISAVLGCSDRDDHPTGPSTEPAPPHHAAPSASPAPALAQLAAGGRHTCGVTALGAAYCWGENESGELGNGSLTSTTRPSMVSGGLAYRLISASTGQTCAITTDNRLFCWGEPFRLGVPSPPVTATRPLAVAPERRFQAVSVGANHTCALTLNDRRAYCWGDNTDGALGDGTTTSRVTPIAVIGNRKWARISAGNLFTCGITTARVTYCWGGDYWGQLGNGAPRQRKLLPSLVAGEHRFQQISAGEFHVCAVDDAHAAWCWGVGLEGNIGDGSATNRLTPTAVVGGHLFHRITAGINHTCAESTTDQTYCWGLNSVGEAGSGAGNSPRFVTQPSLVVGGYRFVQVDADGDHTCGRTRENAVRCWGFNAAGQLGDGTNTDRNVPTAIVGP